MDASKRTTMPALKTLTEELCRAQKSARRQQLLAWLVFALSCAAFIGAWVATDLLVEQRLQRSFGQVDTSVCIVEPGDCLWSIAQEHAVRGTTTQEVVSWIVERNKLTSSAVQPGEALLVPDQAHADAEALRSDEC